MVHNYLKNLRTFFCKDTKNCKIKRCDDECPYTGFDVVEEVNDGNYQFSRVRCIFVNGLLKEPAKKYLDKLVEENVILVRGG